MLVAGGEPLRLTAGRRRCRAGRPSSAGSTPRTPTGTSRRARPARRPRPPGGPCTRVDTGYQGYREPYYDSLLAKVIVWAPDRGPALRRMDRALAEFEIEGTGINTTLALHRALLRHPDVNADRHDVQFLDRRLPELLSPRGVRRATTPAPDLPATAHGSLQLVQTPAGVARPDPSAVAQ